MPITFNCPCGKSLRVADEHAGKRIKCPACQTVGTAPKAEPAFEVVEDEPEKKPAPAPAKPKLAPKPAAKPTKPAPRDEEDPGFTVEEDEDEKPKPKKKPTFSKGSRRDEDDDDEEDERPKKKMTKRRRDDDEEEDERPRRRSDTDAGKKIMYLIGGAVLALAGVAIAVFWWQDGPHTGRRPYSGYILGACCMIVGIATSIKGITGNFDDDE